MHSEWGLRGSIAVSHKLWATIRQTIYTYYEGTCTVQCARIVYWMNVRGTHCYHFFLFFFSLSIFLYSCFSFDEGECFIITTMLEKLFKKNYLIAKSCHQHSIYIYLHVGCVRTVVWVWRAIYELSHSDYIYLSCQPVCYVHLLFYCFRSHHIHYIRMIEKRMHDSGDDDGVDDTRFVLFFNLQAKWFYVIMFSYLVEWLLFFI